ncbi:MAG TPA: Mur ligase family protein [Thermotogota bacterium]|nr:Mur ligase family protein [Thermotogota bacterium]HRW33738.1 Mur ligase family protein [Thermotogota bacterium]
MYIDDFLNLLKRVGDFETKKLGFSIEKQSDSESDELFFTTDSRCIKKNTVFIAIKGHSVNGHDFVNSSFQQGALLAIVEEAREYEGICLMVDSVIEFINRMALDQFARFAGYTIAITGSNGKTSTKEWVKNLLGAFHNVQSVFSNKGNMNTEIGLPVCILNELNTPKRYSVIEMGMSKKGDIEYLVDTYRVDFPVLLNVGTAHIGNTGSLENTFQEKSQIFKHHQKEHPLCLNISDPLIKDYFNRHRSNKKICVFGNIGDKIKGFCGVYLNHIDYSFKEERFITTFELIVSNGENESIIKQSIDGIFHRGQLLNLCASLSILVNLQHDIFAIKDFSPFISTVKERFEPVFKNGQLLIKDCYNSSLESLKYALDVLEIYRMKQCQKKIYCVLGSIAEAGSHESEIHEKIGEMLSAKHVDVVFLYTKDPVIKQIQKKYTGEIHIYEKSVELSNELVKRIRENEKAVFLFKASRSIQLEEVYDHVMDAVD